jgi:hypothetical protein
MLVAGLASEVQVSAVGAFLVGIALSGQVAHNAEKLLAPLRDLFTLSCFFGLTTNPQTFLKSSSCTDSCWSAMSTRCSLDLATKRQDGRQVVGVPDLP